MPNRGPGGMLRASLPAVAIVAMTLTACSSTATPSNPTPSGVKAEFTAAAKESGVPENVLLAVSYNMTNWQFTGSTANEMGGYGPMGLLAGTRSDDSGRQGGVTAASVVDTTSQLAVAAKAAGVSIDATRTDPAQNIRAAAALLAKDAKTNDHGTEPSAVSGWYTALATYSQSPSVAGGDAFAADVFGTLRKGVTARASDGETLTLPADPSLPQHAHTAAAYKSENGGTAQTPDCPSELDCRFVPAAYDWSSPDHSDPNNYGNYDPANRPADGNAIQYIIVHDTESSYDSAISAFQDPAHEASANYVIRSSDGQVTQMVPNGDISWDVANWTMNQHSVSIEHEGYAIQGATWYTSALYHSSATLVRYLAAKYHIPLDRQHIIAHEDVPAGLTATQAVQHWDPGTFWNWKQYMELVGAPIRPTGSPSSQMITINPDFATNQPPVTSCDSSGCTTLPAQGTNFVYLRTKPNADAPLINDPLIHPDGSAGTTQAGDWSDKAVSGHQYVMAGRQGDWTAIWYDGQKAWFYNPHGADAVSASGLLASVPAGATGVALYGRAFPALSAYPAAIPPESSWAPTSLTTWTFPAGQSYVVIGEVQSSNYFARLDPANVAGNHTLISDPTKYLLIDYNHRYLFVKSTDVTLSHAG